MDQEKKGRSSPGTTRRPLITSLSHRPPSPGAEETDVTARSQDNAARLLLAALAPGKEGSAGRVLEHLPNTLASSSGAFEVLLSTDLLGHSHPLCISQSELHPGSCAVITYLLRSHRPLVRLPQLIDHPWIASEILLAGDQDYRKTRAEVHNLRDPLHNRVSRERDRVGYVARTFS